MTAETKKSIDPRLIAEWDYERNGDNTPEMFTSGSFKKFFWICPQCGYSYLASIANRSKGRACPCCAGKRVVPGINDVATVYPELVCEWSSKNSLKPSEVFYKSATRKIIWKNKYGEEFCISLANRLKRLDTERKRLEAIRPFIKAHEKFLEEHWNDKINGISYEEIKFKNKRWRWKCIKCGSVKIVASVEGAEKCACICLSCQKAEKDKKKAQKIAQSEYNLSLSRSFGQAAIAFYLDKLDEVCVEQEVLLKQDRRYRVDIVAHDMLNNKYIAIEHDSDKYHFSANKIYADMEKNELMKERFSEVIHIVEGGHGVEFHGSKTYYYPEGRVSALKEVICRLVSDSFQRNIDVDFKRDTMNILRFKNYHSKGMGWNRYIFERLSEDWLSDNNAGFNLEDFSPGTGYYALWCCKNCGNLFYAKINDRVKGSGCKKCRSRYKKVKPHESFAYIYPEKALNWSEENDMQPTDLCAGSSYKAKWKCSECGHEWQTSVYIVAKSKHNGCLICGREQSKNAKYKRVEKMDPESREVLYTYESLTQAKNDGFKKVDRAIKENKIYKGFLWKLKDK